MASYSFQSVLVWDVLPGGALRTLRNGKVTVKSAADDSTITVATSDANGLISVTATVPTIYYVTANGFVSEHITAATAIEAAAAAGVNNDIGTAALVNSTSSATRGALNSTFVPQSVIDTTQPAQAAQITTPGGSAKNGLRIVNAANSYGLKVDQSGAGGVHDTVNIAANFAGAHTPLSVNSLNDTLSTVKIVNSAAQAGGAVIAAVGDNAGRVVSLFNGDNSGAGPTYLSTMKASGTAVAFQASYDAATSYSNSAVWINAHHTGSNLILVDNDKAHTSGAMIRLNQTAAGSTVPMIYLSNGGSGDHISADNFAVSKSGQVKATQIYNFASFNNARLQLNSGGATVDRNVADANPTLKINNSHASNTGDTLQILGAGGVYGSRFNKDAFFITKKNAAPADADLTAGEMALWFDSTNGAAKLMVKSKQADGTVRTGSVTLA